MKDKGADMDKIDYLIESMLPQEQRFIIQANNFDSLENKNFVDTRSDWYFDNHRIRHIVQKGPKVKLDAWQQINSKEDTNSVKKKTTIGPQNETKLDKESNFRITVISKRPVVDGTELYLEKAIITKDNDKIEFVTTEAEDTEDLKRIKLLTKLPQITGVKAIGAKSMKDIARDKLSKKERHGI